jgi:hypothetical protein
MTKQSNIRHTNWQQWPFFDWNIIAFLYDITTHSSQNVNEEITLKLRNEALITQQQTLRIPTRNIFLTMSHTTLQIGCYLQHLLYLYQYAT